jgi:hypothetical protein
MATFKVRDCSARHWPDCAHVIDAVAAALLLVLVTIGVTPAETKRGLASAEAVA